ncbi:unnamed protein product [Tilletia controversa]|uniref:Uncharacterized protein n=1 Tax=Tilletia controversa TaxID=13291 RepID=A0A8X7MQ67_9BASI|nr:hypothetical protein A4X06_0g5807 [Tilletia controversa]CAD6895853.1 unnamed protein product [Tilletia controversa]CAD6918074.1 unnamed protein product [Tilletia controversa]CAD6968882.1 unnamed protein product [Tilletia controversa]
MSRRREQVAYCYCYTKCTLGDGPPRKVQRRTRAQHLESDRHELRPAHLHGIEPSPLLVKAIDITSSAITADDDDDSSSAEQSASGESGSLGSEAASNAFPGPAGHPSDDLDQSVPFAFDGGDVDQGLFEGDSSDGADSRTDEEAEMRIIDPMDVDEDLISDLDSQDEGSVQEGDLVAADLPLFVRGHDSSDGEDDKVVPGVTRRAPPPHFQIPPEF